MIERNEKGQFKKGSHWRPRKPYYDRDYLYDLYITQEKSSSEIAKMFDVNPVSIQFWLRKHNIPRRNTSESRKVKCWGSFGESNPMYGKYGELNPNYKGGVAPERQCAYSRSEWKALEASVLERANGVCERCGEPSERLHIHHIIPLKSGGDIVCEPSKLICLCPKCHGFIHSKKNVNHELLQTI